MEQKEIVEILMNNGIKFAEKMLTDYGEFHPYARTMSKDGSIVDVASHDGREYPPGDEALEFLTSGLRSKVKTDNDIAVAIFSNATLKNENNETFDAVQVELEHKDGYTIAVYYPYSIESDSVLFSELIAMQREPNVFNQ